jgi:hypothetical protein
MEKSALLRCPGSQVGPLVAMVGLATALALCGATPAQADSAGVSSGGVDSGADDSPPSQSSRDRATPASGRSDHATAESGRSDYATPLGRSDHAAPKSGRSARPRSNGPASVATSASMALAAPGRSGGLAALFNNQPPTLSPAQTGQGTNGVVSGSLNAEDPDSTVLAYAVVNDPAHGSAAVNNNGSYTYTPNPTYALTGTTDSFEVSVSDAGSGFHLHGLSGLINLLTFGLIGSSGHTSTRTVAVAVAPFTVTLPVNTPPTGIANVGSPDPATGVVTGTVVGSDADGDPLTYSGPTTTAKGSLSVSGSGSFTYTPSAVARQNAEAPEATDADRQDAFDITIDDGRGGTVAVPVVVPIGTSSPGGSGELAAFPGAEGFGSFATGGRGGSVVYVTNTNASGPGSLQWAIDQPGAKYILFKVSGLIDAQIHLTNGNVTIAGQTSPGGITIRGLVTDETPYQDQTVRAPGDFAENWILQHIRIRPGNNAPSDDGLRLRYTRNAIVDHVSIGNANDEAVEISYSNNITIQNTIIAETLGGHSFYGGVLMNYSNPAYGFQLDNVSLHHNIFDRIEGRLPEGSRESSAAANSTMNLELSNNLYWDPRFFVALGTTTNVVTDPRGNPYPIYWRMNAVNNYFRVGNQFPYGMFDDQILGVSGNQLFVSGNKMSGYPNRADYELFYCCNDYRSVTNANATSTRAQRLTARLPFPNITYTPTDSLRTVLLNTAGAWPRDPMDTRLLQPISQDTISSAPPNTNPANDALLPAYSGPAPAAPADTDNDGMPDSWEVAKGLNPNVPNTNGTNLSGIGYTDLEVYLHELSASRINGAGHLAS